MAGISHTPGKSGRKQWTLHDGPKGSLRRLRSQLAEDGCPESQVVLAKQLLEECSELSIDKEENAKLGVYWLTKASEQGNVEATDILRQCLISGRGINEHNYCDVKSCLDMSQDEKLARRAAREMFTSLSNGEDFITTEQLQRRMIDFAYPSRSKPNNSAAVNGKTLQNLAEEEQDPEHTDEDELSEENNKDRVQNVTDWSEQQGEKITESVLVSAASNYAKGLLPVVSNVLYLTDPNQTELDAIPVLQRPFVYPLASLKRLYSWLLNTLGQKAIPLRKIFFTSRIHVFILILMHALLGTESVVLFVPMILYYLSFTVMIIATFQILSRIRELHDLRIWSQLFVNYSGGHLNPEEAEYQFAKKSLKPYGHFFLALLLNLLCYPLISHQWTPQSEFTVISFALTLITLVNFVWNHSSKYPDFLLLFSFALHVLARYPYDMDLIVSQNWRFLDLRVPAFATYLIGNGVEFCLNFRIVFYLMMPIVFVKIAARDHWHGTYKTLIPHCVTLSWWQMAILSSQGATTYGLIRGTLALVGVVLFLPIIALSSIILPVIATAKYMSENDLTTRLALTAILGGMPFLASWYLKKTRNPQRFNWIITFLQVFIGISAGLFLSYPLLYKEAALPPNPFEINMELSWEQYQNYCHQPAWEELASKAQVQEQCAHLEGIPVSWEGYVTNVKMKSIKNNLEFIVNQFPKFLENPLKCAFGELHENNCDSISDLNTVRKMTCETLLNLRRKKSKCHLSAWNDYEYEISVKMKNGIWGSNTQIQLIGDRSFSNFSLNIYPGDKIWFTGTLLNKNLESESLLGGSNPHILLNEIGCHVCHTIDLKSSKKRSYQVGVDDILSSLHLGLKVVLNFLLNPIINFK